MWPIQTHGALRALTAIVATMHGHAKSESQRLAKVARAFTLRFTSSGLMSHVSRGHSHFDLHHGRPSLPPFTCKTIPSANLQLSREPPLIKTIQNELQTKRAVAREPPNGPRLTFAGSSATLAHSSPRRLRSSTMAAWTLTVSYQTNLRDAFSRLSLSFSRRSRKKVSPYLDAGDAQ